MSEYANIGYAAERENEQRKFLSGTYGWMAVALLISAASAFITANSYTLLSLIFTSWHYWVLFAGELALVWWLSASIRKISLAAAVVGFLAYSVLNGMTLASIFFIYRIDSIAIVFISCAAMFAGMALYGLRTKSNLSSYGRYLVMAVWGILIASLLNILFKSSGLSFLISIASVAIFAGLTAYDSQKMLALSENADGSEAFRKVSILGALELYLDFINMFLSLLRIFGRRR
ncbi:MAG: Bax inhibitor-1/YccA family protein [Treponema sp.]|nr:Bax inhibitor-1/YccA family protein [Treponema sp.]